MKNNKNEIQYSLSQLDKKYFEMVSNNSSYSSGLVNKFQKLLIKPLSDYTIEDMRLMVGQNVGLEFLIPIVMEVLEKNIFVEGDYYEGDLLMVTLQSDSSFWLSNLALYHTLLLLFEQNIDNLFSLDTTDEIKSNLLGAYERFKDLYK